MLPDPENYADWKQWARAVNREIEATGLTSGGPLLVGGGSGGGGPATSITMPDGYKMVWLSQAEGDLFLGNPDFDPPDAADLFQIDTRKIADAAIATRNLGEEAVTSAKIKTATIGSAQIGDGVIVTALIGEAQIVTSKIGDAQINNAKIADLAVNSAKIANLSVGAAHIIDGQIINVKIGNEISSYGYDGVNGWRIAKDGSIRGTNITILNPDGSVAFASGSKVTTAQIIGLGALATADSVDLGSQTSGSLPASRTTGFGALALADFVDLATRTVGSLDRSRTTGFGSMAALNMLTQGNISTYIEGAAIVRALIGTAAIGTANIDNAAITTALIANAAIIAAHIQDAAITNAKIANLSFDKMTAGTLNARVDMGAGLIVFNVGGSQLVLGAGFGVGQQFVLWFGPNGFDPSECDAQRAVMYLDRNGGGYFGGGLSSGKTTNSAQTSLLSADVFELGPFTSAGRNTNVYLTVGFATLIEAGESYEGDQYFTPEGPDPFTGVRQVWRQHINALSNVGFILASNAEDFTSTSIYRRIGSTGGAEPQGIYRWEHRIGGNQSRTISRVLGVGTDRFVRVTRESLVRVSDGANMRPMLDGNGLGIRTVED